jgi:hypothetical protein
LILDKNHPIRARRPVHVARLDRIAKGMGMRHRSVRGPGPLVAVLTPTVLLVICTCAAAAETSLGLGFGATAGFGVQADITFQDFTRNIPLSFRFSGAYSGRDAGNALDARRVFINDNTNGTPEQSGSTWQLRLDLMAPAAMLGPVPVRIGAGLRKAYFTASFDFVGGNEKFDVSSDPWGAGAFAEGAFDVSDALVFTLQLGLDYFFDARLEGHDTAYEPDGDDVNPRNDYTWETANDAINQPRLEPYGLIALRLRLGI